MRHIHKGMPKEFDRKFLKLKRGDIRARTRGDLTTVVWKDKREVYMLTNIHSTPIEGNFCDDHGNAICPPIVKEYKQHMGYADKGDNSYSISCATWKWTKKLYFHFVYLKIINSWILLTSYGAKYSHRQFWLTY